MITKHAAAYIIFVRAPAIPDTVTLVGKVTLKNFRCHIKSIKICYKQVFAMYII
jgi:hypothetical protein